MSVNMRYCRSSEGVLVHQPLKAQGHNEKFVDKLKRKIEGFLDDNEVIEDNTSIILYDTAGQSVRVLIENNQGGGGQRHISVYCPYWIVNTSQYAFRIREEGEVELPAGSVSAQK